MSALPPKSGHRARRWACPLCANSGQTHRSKKKLLFDHLVGAGEQRWGNGEAERFGCVQIDDQFELGGRLHRKLARLRALENTVDVDGGASKQIHKVDAVRHQTPFFYGKTIGRNARYTVSRRQFDNAVAMNDIETVRHHDQSWRRAA